jgi:pimeloyl-ACP methyl ester carboxylesterase
MDLLADDLAALLEALAIQQSVCLCGLSMGGYVAFQFALRHRSWLDGGGGLILCDTRAEADTDEGRQAREQTAQRVLAEGPEFLADTMVERLFSGGTRRRAAESGAVPTREALLVERTKTVMRQTSRRGLAAAARGMAARPDMTPWLPTFDFPALVLCGADDAITPPTVMRDLAARLPRATYVEIPGAGHMAPLEAPETVNVAIAEFLSSLS